MHERYTVRATGQRLSSGEVGFVVVDVATNATVSDVVCFGAALAQADGSWSDEVEVVAGSGRRSHAGRSD